MALYDTPSAYWKLDESSGNPQDSSGNAKHMVNVGTMPFGAVLINNGIVPDGSSRMVALQDDALGFTRDSQSMSWNFWIKTSSWSTYICQITTSAGSGGGVNMLMYGDSAGHAKLYVGGNEVTSGALSTNTLYMFTIVKTGTTYELFINGTSQGTVSTGAQTSTVNTFALGANTNDGGHTVAGSPITGAFDEASVYAGSLSGSEMSFLYNSGSGRQYPYSTTSIKSINGLAYASIKSVNGLAIASVKSFNGLA